jgi:DnaJ-class molecular chaperone
MTTATTKRQAASQRKYSDWLGSNARDNGVSFGEWLKQGAADIEPEPYCDTCRGTGLGQTDSSFCWACAGSGDSRGRDAFGRRYRDCEH